MKSVVAPVATSFKFSVKTDNVGSSGTNQFTIATKPLLTYNYNVTTSEESFTNQTGNVTLTWSSPGTYDVEISGTFPSTYFGDGWPTGDRLKVIDIKRWGNNVWSNITAAFAYCDNLDVTATDVPDLSNVTSLNNLFQDCSSLVNSNGSISNWEVSTITTMLSTFQDCSNFNVDISNWNVTNVFNMQYMFANATSFNQSIGSWTMSNVLYPNNMFSGAHSFNQDISNWDTSSMIDMSGMFAFADHFNQDLNTWDVSSATIMSLMFAGATSFNGNISSWNTQNALNMSYMFGNAKQFNQNIGGWTVSSVTNMSTMFQLCPISCDLSSWDVSNVTNMDYMFKQSGGSGWNIGGWTVSNVIYMNNMFDGSIQFNEDISGWDVQKVINFSYMFQDAINFNQLINFDASTWLVYNTDVDMSLMFSDAVGFGSGMSTENYTDTLVLFANIVKDYGHWLGTNFSLQNSMTFDGSRAGGTNFEFAADARNYLLDTFGEITADWGPGSEWIISGDTVI